MKRVLSILLSVIMVCGCFGGLVITNVEADDMQSVKIGDCITLGTYLGEPIVWRCVDIDENGPLMLSDRILCVKEYDSAGKDDMFHTDGWSNSVRKKYGSNCWFDSNIRQWLNTEGMVEYTHCPPSYSGEIGFVSSFSTEELALVKTVTQKSYVNEWENHRTGYVDGGTQEASHLNYISKLNDNTEAYWYQNVTDRFFLLGRTQLYNIYENNPNYLYCDDGYFTRYVGNNGASYENVFVVINEDYIKCSKAYGKSGIRPAFYLANNTDNIEMPDDSVLEFATYFANYLGPYYNKMINVDMPCQTIISDGGSTLVTWNAFVLSLKSLPDFKLGVDEKSFYEAILFDLITDTVSSVDYEKEMKKQTMDMVNMLVDFLIDKGVDVSKENCSKADLDDMYTALSDYWFAKDIQMTKEVYDAFADGCNNAEDCIEKIGVYAVAMQQSQNLVEALKLMSKESEKDSNAKTLKSALDEMVDLMNMEPLECVNYVLDEKVIEMGTDAAVNVICNFALDTIKEVFPIDIVLDCIKVADWGSNLIYPTSLSSEQQYRIYALYHVEDIARQSFATAWSNYQNNKTEENANIVNSCYDMFVRIYEHEIIECEALAELIYKKGILNGIKNYFSSNSMDDYYFAVDWVKSYNANLEIMKNYKYNAYLSWGIAYDKLEPVIYVSVIDGKVVNYTVSGADVGSTVYFPDFSQANKIINRTKLKYIGDFEGWYYDEDCTSPCFANNAVANEPIIRYAKFSSRNGKKIQVKCPVNVEVYDSDNVLCLKIEDNKTVVDNGSLSVVITDSCKEIFVPDGQYYTVNLTAFDDGVMNYSVTEINNSIATKRVNFYDVSLYDGQVYNGQVELENNLPRESYALTTLSDNGETLVEMADEELYQNEMQTLDIAVMVEGNGCASNGALVTKGDYVKLSATPDEAESFLGWYSNDSIISSECDLGFIAKESMNIVAKFTVDGQNSSETEPTEPSTGGQDNPTEPTEPSTGNQYIPTDSTEPTIGGEDKPTDSTEPSTSVQDIPTDPTNPVVLGLLGDANEDGKINIKDATLIQKSIANLTELTETGEALADADLNTKINIKDATAIQKHIAGIETVYPIGKPKTK